MRKIPPTPPVAGSSSWVVWASVTTLVFAVGLVLARVLPDSAENPASAPDRPPAVASYSGSGFAANRNPFGSSFGTRTPSNSADGRRSQRDQTGPSGAVATPESAATDTPPAPRRSVFRRAREQIGLWLPADNRAATNARAHPQPYRDPPAWALSDYDFNQWWATEEPEDPPTDEDKAFDEWWDHRD